MQYRKLLPAMIGDWRKLFGQGDFPFYIVGLPAFKAPPRHARRRFLGRDARSTGADRQERPNSCLAVTIDTGDPDNIHPIDKKEVGERLALCALAEHYGKQTCRTPAPP